MFDINTFDCVNFKMLVEPLKAEQTESGFLNIEQGNTTPTMGKVIKSASANYKVGDILFFRRYSCDHISFNTKDGGQDSIYIVEDADVVGVQRIPVAVV
jgi:hypothetical protein